MYTMRKCLCPHDKSAVEICFFTKNLKIENVICANVSENRLPETKNNSSGIDISWPTPSVPSASVSPSCSLAKTKQRVEVLKHVFVKSLDEILF